jgi:hypothetical protein
MKKYLLTVIVVIMLSLGLLFTPMSAKASLSPGVIKQASIIDGIQAALQAINCNPGGGLKNGANCAGQGQGLAQGSIQGYIKAIINVLLSLVGVVSVIMIIYGGFRYALSGGDENSVKAAKDTILYAVIGLIVAILAFVIVNFVLGIFGV